MKISIKRALAFIMFSILTIGALSGCNPIKKDTKVKAIEEEYEEDFEYTEKDDPNHTDDGGQYEDLIIDKKVWVGYHMVRNSGSLDKLNGALEIKIIKDGALDDNEAIEFSKELLEHMDSNLSIDKSNESISASGLKILFEDENGTNATYSIGEDGSHKFEK